MTGDVHDDKKKLGKVLASADLESRSMRNGRSTSQSRSVKIRSRLEIIGVNPFVLVTAKRAAQLRKNQRGPIPVRFQIKNSDAIWRVNLMPVGDGSFRLYLNGEIRRVSRLDVGDTVNLDVQFDNEYKNGPLHPMPTWFGKPLSQNSPAQKGWEQLTPSKKKEILRYFARLKSKESKDRNLGRALHVLAGGQGRFLGTSWNEDSRV